MSLVGSKDSLPSGKANELNRIKEDQYKFQSIEVGVQSNIEVESRIKPSTRDVDGSRNKITRISHGCRHDYNLRVCIAVLRTRVDLFRFDKNLVAYVTARSSSWGPPPTFLSTFATVYLAMERFRGYHFAANQPFIPMSKCRVAAIRGVTKWSFLIEVANHEYKGRYMWRYTTFPSS